MSNLPGVAVRIQAARIISKLLRHKASLATLIPPALVKTDERDRALLQSLCFETCRWQPASATLLQRLLTKPVAHTEVQAILLLGITQLLHMRVPAHAAIDSSVEACRQLGHVKHCGLVNGVLRRVSREQSTWAETLATSPAWSSAHPNWLRKAIEKAWPNQASAIFAANNAHPPLTLRLRDADPSWRAQWPPHQPINGLENAVTLDQAIDVTTLPGFAEGRFSVQDAAAQFTPNLLDAQPHMRVLDACCAPGGKLCHLMEQQPALKLLGLDVDADRLQRVNENLARLNLTAELRCADAAQTTNWWDGEPFDRILLDAPCSGTGVIRRHPDIKLLRQASDIAGLVAHQKQLLDTLWSLLKSGGKLLYATCSILPAENIEVIRAFLHHNQDASAHPLSLPVGIAYDEGVQLLPQLGGHDGFFYALIEKL